MPDIPAITTTHPKVLPAVPAVPERIYDRWAIQEGFISGSGIGTSVTSGHFRFVRFRVLADGVTAELDPEGEVVSAPIGDLHDKAANPDWPEARAFIEAARAFGERLGRQAGVL